MTQLIEKSSITPMAFRDTLVAALSPKFQAIQKDVGHLRAALRVAAAAPSSSSPVRRTPPVTTLARLMTAHFVGHVTKADPLETAARLYGEQSEALAAARDVPAFMAKAVTNPAQTTVAGWAAELVAVRNSGAVAMLSPNSTYVALAARGVRVIFSGGNVIRLPRRADDPDLSGIFVGEGDARPVKRYSFAVSELAARTASFISIFTAELSKRSTPNIEAVLRQCMGEDVAAGVDGILTSDAPPTALSPGGLRNGVTPLAATGGGGGIALAGDLGALAGAIANASDLVILMPEAERLRALTLAPGLAAVTILSAPSLPPKTILALDADDFASGEDDSPDFSVSEAALVVNENSEPMPDAITNNSLSLWQQNLVGLKLEAGIEWAMRRPGRVAFVEDVTW